jgi:hypothetical protein
LLPEQNSCSERTAALVDQSLDKYLIGDLRGLSVTRGSSEHGVLLARLTDTALQRGVGTTSLSPALPPGVQARLGVLLCGGLHQKGPWLLAAEFSLFDGGV